MEKSFYLWLLTLLLLALVMFLIPAFGWDIAASAPFHTPAGFRTCTAFVNFISTNTYAPGVFLYAGAWAVMLVGLFLRRERLQRAGLFLVLMGFLMPSVVTPSLKTFFGRPRPGYVKNFGGCEAFREWTQANPSAVRNEAHRSFPSGHATWAAAFITLFWVIRGRWRWIILALALAWWGTVSAGRVIGGWHYLSDTLGALWLTIFLGGVLVWAIKPQGKTLCQKN